MAPRSAASKGGDGNAGQRRYDKHLRRAAAAAGDPHRNTARCDDGQRRLAWPEGQRVRFMATGVAAVIRASTRCGCRSNPSTSALAPIGCWRAWCGSSVRRAAPEKRQLRVFPRRNVGDTADDVDQYLSRAVGRRFVGSAWCRCNVFRRRGICWYRALFIGSFRLSSTTCTFSRT